MADEGRSLGSALAAFLVLPGTVAFLVPWLLHPAATSFHPDAAPLLAGGVAVLLWCVRDFYLAGRGTLAPWAPPRHLVTVGLYRWSRNPMYVGVLLVLCAWALAYRSATLWAYAAVVAIAFHLRVVLAEEPWLARTFGDAWSAYRGRVSRWLPWPRRTGHGRGASAA